MEGVAYSRCSGRTQGATSDLDEIQTQGQTSSVTMSDVPILTGSDLLPPKLSYAPAILV